MTKVKKRKVIKPELKKGNGKRKAVLILGIVAIAFLAANAIYYFAAKEII